MYFLRLILALLLSCFTHSAEKRCVTHVRSLDYPEVARSARVQGRVVLQLRVSRDGRAMSVAATSGHPILRRSAEENVKTWVFEGGEESELEVEYEFRLEEPKVYYRPPTTTTFELPSKVLVVTNLPLPSHSSQDSRER